MKQWLVPHEGKLNKMVLVDGKNAPNMLTLNGQRDGTRYWLKLLK